MVPTRAYQTSAALSPLKNLVSPRRFRPPNWPTAKLGAYPGGDFCLSLSRDETIRVWDGGTGRHLQTLEANVKSVTMLTMSPDAAVLLSRGMDGRVHVLSTSTSGRVQTLNGHTKYATAAAVSMDGKLCVTGSNDRSVRLWDLSTGQCLRVFIGHSAAVDSVGISLDGPFCISGSENEGLRLWSTATGECFCALEARNQAGCVAFEPGGRLCVSGGHDGEVVRWDLSFVYDKLAAPAGSCEGPTKARQDREGAEDVERSGHTHAEKVQQNRKEERPNTKSPSSLIPPYCPECDAVLGLATTQPVTCPVCGWQSD